MSTSPESTASRADLTYLHPNLKDNTLDEKNLDQTCPLDIGRHHLEPVHDLGELDRLPYELIADILAQVDLRSLFDFRRVNQRALQAADGVPQLKQIIKHHLPLIRAALVVEAGSRFSCIDLLRTLRARDCTHCGDFAGYIYLLDCSRVCFLCFTERSQYLPLTALQVSRKFGVESKLLSGLPRLKSLVGRYSPNQKSCPKRLVLYDAHSAQQLGIALHGSPTAMMKSVADTFLQQLRNYENRVQKYRETGSGPRPRRPVDEVEEHDGLSSNPRRFMGIVHAPWIHSATGVLDYGFHCTGCRREQRNRVKHWRRKFTSETFEEHIQKCGSIRDGKHISST